MKKRYSVSLTELSLLEITDILATIFVIGLALTYFNPIFIIAFLVKYKYLFLVLAILAGIKPTHALLLKTEKKSKPKSKKKK